MPKINPADAEANAIYEAQMKRAARARRADIVMLCIFTVAITVIGILIWAVPQKRFSENENRILQTVDTISLSDGVDNFTSGIADMCRDQFPLRERLVCFKSYLDLALLKQESSGVIAGRDGTLIARLEYNRKQNANFDGNIKAIDKFSEKLGSDGIAVTFAAVPRALDVANDTLPPLYSTERADSILKGLPSGCFDFTDIMTSKPGTQYKTDHHWTTYGAYLAYAALAEKLGYTPADISEFIVETATVEFRGTTYSKSGLYLTPSEKIEYYRYNGDESYSVKEADKVIINGFYDRDKLNEKDKYSSFLGGDYGHITVSDGTEKPRLLIVKDSYFNALAPFLARHFELDIIDLRYTDVQVAKYVRERGIDRVLILCGIDSLANSDIFTMLRIGL